MEPLRFNNLQVRLANNDSEIDASQALRYKVFHEELGATQTPGESRHRRDVDPFDAYCDHLLVIDLERGDAAKPCVVGTYRMLRGETAKTSTGFYSADEFDLSPLLTYPGEIMELGRSCIEAQYRRRGAMQLLWAGIAEYITQHDVGVMFGCGSLHGTEPAEVKLPLAYLHHYHTAPDHLCPRALEHRCVPMGAIEKDEFDTKRALSELPPLLKGYLRLGGYVGAGAVIDTAFNTIDVCVVVETKNLSHAYNRHFVRDRAAAQQTGAAAA
ncbi:MAG: GNAT family N-acetyltransferase [Rhodospirillaceae bacterium]|nr:GNAT family N-acetyltransferase [Rhodospirillaceae bacterium]MDD9917012.1 GNAT family N-acetyltransferase [Rhodospirillaceae bacterium]MDD9927416.1 GNAT family N-acetyltransferase [Rhodospirillaceae bacterium]